MKKAWIVSMALAWTCAAAGAAFADQGFTADMVMHTGAEQLTGKISYSQQKMRFEMPQSIMITRLDKQVTWLVMPAQEMYMEQQVDPKAAVSASKEVPGEIERKSLGKEKNVNGHDAEKFEVAYTDPSGSRSSIYQWIASDVPLPVRVAAVDGSWSVDYQNIVAGDVPGSLFEVPAGYKKFAMPAGFGPGTAEPPQE
jgi:hypothetical protein